MVTITTDDARVTSLNININKPFLGEGVKERAYAKFGEKASDGKQLYLIVFFKYECNSLKNDYQLEAEITVDFILKPRENVDEETVYKCVILTGKILNKIIDAIYSIQKTKPAVKIPEMEDLAENINDILGKT